MAWDGSGNFTRTNGTYTGSGVWTSDRDASVKITASRHDTHDQDLSAGINACLAKNGENAMTGDLDLGTNDITNGGAATFSGAVTGGTVLDASGNVRAGRRNLLINGGFDVWHRATSQTSSGYGSADRWTCENSGTTKTASRQTFTLGQTDVPGNPKYWMRHVVTTSAGASNYCRMAQRIEGVKTAAGQTVAVSFYAKADSSKNIALDLGQSFGTGGSPSSAVTSIGAQKFALTSSWQRFTASIAVTSISGKTLGTNDDNYFLVRFWFDAGSSFNSQTDSLGQQSGTFDIANVQVEIGSAATAFEYLPIGETSALCERYYQKTYVDGVYPADVSSTGRILTVAAAATTTGALMAWHLPVKMRAAPTVTVYSPTTGASSNVRNETAGADAASSTSVACDGRVIIRTSGAATDGSVYACHATADAEL